MKALLFFATVFALGMAVLLMFVPVTGLFFWLVALALLPAESRTAATVFDRIEVLSRREWRRLRGARARPAADSVPRAERDVVTQPVPEPSVRERTEAEPVLPPAAAIERPARVPRVVAGTLKIWSSEPPRARPATYPALNSTIVLFPPPPDAERPSRPNR